jgi:hypothetical protein
MYVDSKFISLLPDKNMMIATLYFVLSGYAKCKGIQLSTTIVTPPLVVPEQCKLLELLSGQIRDKLK